MGTCREDTVQGGGTVHEEEVKAEVDEEVEGEEDEAVEGGVEAEV